MKKRLLSGFLAVCMVFTLLPTQAFATEQRICVENHTVHTASCSFVQSIVADVPPADGVPPVVVPQSEAVEHVLALITALPSIDELTAQDTESADFPAYLAILLTNTASARLAFYELTAEEKVVFDIEILAKLTELEGILAAIPVPMDLALTSPTQLAADLNDPTKGGVANAATLEADGKTVTLNAVINNFQGTTIADGTDVILNLNGNTITGSSGATPITVTTGILTITGGSITGGSITGGGITGGDSNNLGGNGVTGNVDITGSVAVAITGGIGGSILNMGGSGVAGDVTITGSGAVTITGGNGNNTISGSNGGSGVAGDVTITGSGTVTITGGGSSMGESGIGVLGAVTAAGTGAVIITGGTSNGYSNGGVTGNVTVTGTGAVTITGGTRDELSRTFSSYLQNVHAKKECQKP